MSATPIRDETLARLRANTARAGVPLPDDDIARITAGPFLGNVDNFVRIVGRYAADTLPDYLRDTAVGGGPWTGDGGQAAVDSATATAAQSSVHGQQATAHAPLHAVAAAIAARQVSPVELTEAILARIAEHDPHLSAYQMVLAEQARAAAAEAEREIMAGNYLGPFHGVPVAVKDLLATAGLPTTAGSKILADWVPDRDATAVRRLKEAGAVIVGKTRMSEFAYSPASNNAHYGPTRNPWHAERDTGGSSSGSGAAVAAGLAYMALGSDTGGSIRMPSALCGIVGLKPTHGRISLAGAITLSWALDHLGPMTRTVRDAALTLNLLAGYDPDDIRTRRGPVPDFTAGLDDPANARGLRIGAIRDDGSPFGPPDAEVLGAWEDGLRALRDAGAEIVDLDLPELEELRVVGSAFLNLEALTYHEPFLRDRPGDYGPFAFDRLRVAYAYGPTAAIQAQQVRAVLRARLEALFDRVDLVSTPAMPYGAPPLGEPRTNTRYSIPFNALSWPAIVVPTGLTGDGLPLGIQLAGRLWDEATVLRAARVIERDGPWQGRTPTGF
jgi:aspartyl-tRNA(Asn)/glutamyl-tRNA(Gln) amidotransferase subunit A